MTTHATHRMHENSIAANKTLDKVTRADEVKAAIEAGGTMTDREVRDALGYQEMNQVRPTITGLLDAGELIECGRMLCEHTGRSVRTCRRCTGTPERRVRLEIPITRKVLEHAGTDLDVSSYTERISPTTSLAGYVRTALEHALESGLTLATISGASGMHRVNLSRYRSKKADITLETADRLMQGLDKLNIPAPLCAACG